MRVVVLGASGFVGRHVLNAFKAAGHEVTALVRPTSDRSNLGDVRVVEGDVLRPETLRPAFRGQDVVVHSAGQMALWTKEDQLLYDVNVFGTRNVVEACLAVGVGRLVYTGSVGIYGGTHEPIPVNEDGSRDVARFHSFHVTSMCLAQAEVYRGMSRGLDAVMIHPSFCFGEGDRHFHSSWAIVGLACLRVPFVPPGGLNLVDVLDVARAHLLAAEMAPPGGNYLVGGENLTNAAFADMLAEVLDLRSWRLPMTRSGLRRFGEVAEWIAKVRGVDRGGYVTLNRAMGKAMGLYWFFDDTKARRELGHHPTPVRPAIERQVAWLQAEGLFPGSGFGVRDFYDAFLGGKSR